MSIQSDLIELENLKQEISRRQEELYKFKKARKVVEDRIIEFLKHQETHGVKYNNKAILLETKDVRTKKRKNDKLHDIKDVLRKHNISVSEDLISEIVEAQRGNKIKNNSLKIIQK